MLNRKNNNHNNMLAYYNPFREMDELEKRFFGDPFGYFKNDALADFKTDLKDEGDSFVLEADLPGFDKKDIHLDLDGDTLTISAERHSQREEKDNAGKYLCCERSYGSFSRQFDVSGIQTDAIKAKYENGVLTLDLPKEQKVLPAGRRLEIE
jgi:HSP20 family protein